MDDGSQEVDAVGLLSGSVRGMYITGRGRDHWVGRLWIGRQSSKWPGYVRGVKTRQPGGGVDDPGTGDKGLTCEAVGAGWMNPLVDGILAQSDTIWYNLAQV